MPELGWDKKKRVNTEWGILPVFTLTENRVDVEILINKIGDNGSLSFAPLSDFSNKRNGHI